MQTETVSTQANHFLKFAKIPFSICQNDEPKELFSDFNT